MKELKLEQLEYKIFLLEKILKRSDDLDTLYERVNKLSKYLYYLRNEMYIK